MLSLHGGNAISVGFTIDSFWMTILFIKVSDVAVAVSARMWTVPGKRLHNSPR